jgi:L-fuconolactonase
MTGSLRRIDAHHHLWRYVPEEFEWIDETMLVLRQDFSESDLAREAKAAGITGTVAVQACQSLEETRFLCGLAETSPLILGVVGWAPIMAAPFPKILEEVCDLPRLVGLRHIVQGELPGFLDAPAFNAGIGHLVDARLTYDILIAEHQMEEAIRFVDRHPQQHFVLDHIAKPRIATGELEPWATNMRELARRPNVMSKISGMVTEANWNGWTMEMLRPYLDVCVESFGPGRLMAGSDWPVCLLASSYKNWWNILQGYFDPFSEEERDSIFAANAIRFYRLETNA